MSQLLLVAVDIGNSSTKLGWDFDAGGASMQPVPRSTFRFPTGESPPLELLTQLPSARAAWHICSVHRQGTQLLRQWLSENRAEDEVRVLTYRDLPVPVRTAAPERVGLDRLAAVVTANQLRAADRPAIVVSAGSAITVNVVAYDGGFEGGAILPGYRMSAEALYGADQLPLTLLVPDEEPPPALGTDTQAAIRSGLFWGAVGGVRELIERLSSGLERQPEVFVTGGDVRRLSDQLADARFIPNMVLSGIALAMRGDRP